VIDCRRCARKSSRHTLIATTHKLAVPQKCGKPFSADGERRTRQMGVDNGLPPHEPRPAGLGCCRFTALWLLSLVTFQSLFQPVGHSHLLRRLPRCKVPVPKAYIEHEGGQSWTPWAIITCGNIRMDLRLLRLLSIAANVMGSLG